MTFDPLRGDRRRPPHHYALWALTGLTLLGFFSVFTGQCALDRFTARAYPPRSLPPEPTPSLLPPPETDDEYLPCSDCHGDEPALLMRRELDEHDDIELKHGDLWCMDCHDGEDHQRLHLSDASLISFEESWRLCTRCHATKLADWRAGVHGKRTGYWWGPKEYRTCVACHRPHAPRFERLAPKPPPLRSADLRPRSLTAQEGIQHE